MARYVRMVILGAIVALLATGTLAAAGGAGSPQQCRGNLAGGKTLIRNQAVACRDGDPRCDADGQCNGTCTMPLCLVVDYVDGCPFLGAAVCAKTAVDVTPWSVDQIPVGHPEVMTQYISRALGTRMKISCLSAAPKCDYSLPGDSVPHD